MGYHHCPIEPSDWSNGPDDDSSEECPDCDSGRVNRPEITVDGITYPPIVDQKCETCDGNGFIEPSDYEPDWLDLE